MKIREILETSSSGATSSGGIASVAMPLSGSASNVIKRIPNGQSFFGQQPLVVHKTKKKRPKQS